VPQLKMTNGQSTKNNNPLKEENHYSEVEVVGRYIRLSQEDRKSKAENISKSLENQDEVTKYVCDQRGFKSILYDEGYYTGTDRQRPVFIQMEKDLDSGKIQAIMVKRQSRLARDTSFANDFLTKCHRLKIPVFDITQNIAEDPVKFRMQGIMDEMVSDQARIEQEAMMERKIREGKPFGKAPFGYRNNTKTKEWDVIPKEAQLVQRAYHLAYEGINFKKIAKEIGVANSTAHKMIRDKKYTGIFSFTPTTYFWEGHKRIVQKKATRQYKANYEPIISTGTFNRLQEFLNEA